MKTLFVFSLVTMLASSVLAQEVPLAPQQAVEFAEAILPNETDKRFHKWADSPRISCVGQAVVFKPLVEQFVSEISATLAGTPVQPTLIEDNAEKAEIYLVIDSSKNLEAVRRRENSTRNSPWTMSLYPDSSFKRFVSYNDIKHFSNLTGDSERRIIYVALLKALGFNDTKGYATISIWGRFNMGTKENALWEKDKKLIRTAYEFISYGASKEDIRRVIKKNWK